MTAIFIASLLGIGVITLVYLAVRFRGPYLLHKLFPGCSVKSVSLRSIRGIRITHGAHVIEIGRVGLSFGRQPDASGWFAFRCSIRTSDVTCRSFEKDLPQKPPIRLQKPPPPSEVHSLRSRRSRFSIQNFALFADPDNDTVAPPLTILKRIAPSLARRIDSWLRPLFRILFVAAFRVLIRFLPTLMQAVDFELNHATLTLPRAHDLTVLIEQVRVSTQVEFSQLEKVIDESIGGDIETSALRRLSRMGNWRFRLKGSWERTWNRAWGQTNIFSAVSVHIGNVEGSVRPNLPAGGSTSTTIAEPPTAPIFKVEGASQLTGSVRFIPGRATFERQSLELVVSLGELSLDLGNAIDSARRVSGMLASRHGAPIPEEKISEEPLSPASPLLSPPLLSPPLMSATTKARILMMRRRFQERSRKRGILSLPEVFRKIDFRLPKFECTAKTDSTISTTALQDRLRFEINDIFLKSEVSNPGSHELHRQWLGNSTVQGKGEALAHEAGFGATRLGWMHAPRDAVVPLLTLNRFTMSALSTPPRLEPNQCLVVVQAALDPLAVSGTMKDIQALGALAKRFTSPPSPRRAPTQSLMHIPRLVVDIQTGGFDVLFCLDNHGPRSVTPAGVHLLVPQLELHGYSEFIPRPWTHRDQSHEPFTESKHLTEAPYLLRFSLTGLLGPADLQVIYEDRVPMGQLGRHSVVRLSQVELQANGDVLAAMLDGDQLPSIDKTSAVTHGRCVSDSLVVDMTNSEALSVLPDFLSASPPTKLESSSSRTTHKKSPLEALPAGINVHFAIGTISCLASGRDLAPGNAKPVRRGIELRVGLALGYSLMHDRQHSYRTRGDRFASTQHRDRLQLPDNILCESASISQELNENAGEKGAVLRLGTFNFQIRPIVDFGSAFIPICDWEAKSTSSVPTALLNIPQIRVDILLKRTAIPQSASYNDTCRVVAEIPCVRLNLSVHHAYCLALSSSAFPRAKHAFSAPPPPPPSSAHKIVLHALGNIGNIQARVDLPGTQRVYLCLEKTKLALRDPHREVSFGTLHGWALSADGKWDEVLRMRQFEILAPPDQSQAISITGQGARLRIPHEYSFASLIQEISLAAKTVKHLFHIIQAGHFIAMGTPEAEDAKRVPPLVISINALSIEAVDDPFETKLSLLWRAGRKEQQERLVRQDAFNAKVEAIRAESGNEHAPVPNGAGSQEWHFGGKHTIPIEEAHQRLQQFNSSAWISALNTAKMAIVKREETQLRRVGQVPGSLQIETPVPLDIREIETVPPLIRLLFDGVRVELAEPSFSGSSLPEFLKRTGGLPLDTQYTLLVPISIRWEMRYAMVTLRDYPLPLLHVRPSPDQSPSWTASADLVIAEEIGPSDSVEWLSSTVVPQGLGLEEQAGFSILVPKTGMPVKTYANPVVHVTSPEATDISWGVSYQPCVSDVVRVVDSLSHPSRDPSPPLGFWDKFRLSLHGKLRISFVAGLNLLIKGSRDPYEISGNGAGFALCLTGHPEIFVGYHLDEKELIQFRGERMVVGIPNLPSFGESRSSEMETSRPSSSGHTATPSNAGTQRARMQKICAKLTNGVKLGLGFVLERRCGPDCTADHTSGPCRRFNFRPHHDVKLRPSSADPKVDSFAGFRSDYIHFSLSLISPTKPIPSKAGYNSFHLSPKAFAHFFSWWNVFNPPNGPMLLPIRQGSLYPSDKPPPLKFTRHLVTIKYKFSLSPLFISHVYRQDSRASWATGITPCVGIKAVVETFQADLHQRDQVESTKDEATGLIKTKTHKPFYAAEVVAKGLDLRAMLAQFKEPEKPAVALPPLPSGESVETTSSARSPMPEFSKEILSSRWVDLDDFVETDWASNDKQPGIWLFTAASCPRITYFKKPERPAAQGTAHTTCSPQTNIISPFGNEDTHSCLMGTELSAIQVQAALCLQRIEALENELSRGDTVPIRTSIPIPVEMAENRQQALEKKIELLREHLDKLESTELHLAQRGIDEAAWVSTGSLTYEPSAYFEADVDWSQFDNIYQIHCPQVHLNNNTRDILLDYYYSSRNRRGFEYHLSERAVRFIREQQSSSPLMSKSPRMSQDSTYGPTPRNRAQAAAHTIRKIFTAEGGSRDSSNMDAPQPIKCQAEGEIEPASGWKTNDIIVNKSHLCLLLNPQFTLRSTADAESILVITAARASLQTFAILDKNFVDGLAIDPINANIMKRNYGSLSGLQVFSPSRARDRTINITAHEVPLEVLLDLRCESNDFDRLVPQTDATLQYDKFNRLRLRNKVTSATVVSAEEADINNHLQSQNDRIILNVDKLAVSANAQNFVAIYNIVSDLLLYTDPDQRERTRQLQTFMYSYDFRDFMASAGVVSELQQRLRSLLDTEMRLALSKGQVTEERLMTRAHIFLMTEELNLIFKAIRVIQEQGENSLDENKSNMRFDVFAKEFSWTMLEDTNDTLAKVSVRGIEYAWHSQKDSSAAHKLTISDLQALDSSPDAVFSEMLVKLDKVSSHPMVAKSLFAQAEWSILAPVGGIPIVNSFILDLHPVRLQIERKVGRRIMAYIFPHRNISAETNSKPSTPRPPPNTPKSAVPNSPKPAAPSPPRASSVSTSGHKSRSSIGAIAGVGLGMGVGIAGIPRASIDDASFGSGSGSGSGSVSVPRPRMLKKRATSHTDLKDAAAESVPAAPSEGSTGTEAHRAIPRSRSSNALRADAKAATLSSKTTSRVAFSRPATADKEKEKEKDPEVKDDANEMLVRASKNRTFVHVKVAGLAFALSYKRDTPISLTTVPDLDDFRFETPAFEYENETWSFEDMIEVLKKDIYKAAWSQKGALLREVFTKAKIITPKRFLPHENLNKLGWHKRPKAKSSKPAPGTEEGKEKDKDIMDHPSIDNVMQSLISSDSGLAWSSDPQGSDNQQTISQARRPQRPIAQTKLSENSPIGFPGDQEPSPTPQSIASSRESSGSQAVLFPATEGVLAGGRASTSSLEPIRRTTSPAPMDDSVPAPAPYLTFPVGPPASPPKPTNASSSRPKRERVLSLFKKGKKKDLDDGGKPRQSLDVPEVPPLPGMGVRQRTISANAKMQQ